MICGLIQHSKARKSILTSLAVTCDVFKKIFLCNPIAKCFFSECHGRVRCPGCHVANYHFEVGSARCEHLLEALWRELKKTVWVEHIYICTHLSSKKTGHVVCSKQTMIIHETEH